jgi:acetoacetyl-CoA synthetase
MVMESFDDDAKPVRDQAGNMVVLKPFPNQPLYFLEDPGNKRYRASYFEDFTKPVVWCQKDYVLINSKTGGWTMLGK